MSKMKTIKVSQGLLAHEEIKAVSDVMAGGYYGYGNRVKKFEEQLRSYLQVPQVVTTNTGTSALHLALAGIGVGTGDEVIVPSLTYIASFQAISATGATPVACEVTDECLISLADVERRITERTKAVMAVHYAGNPCDLGGLFALKEKYGVRVIEDAAHAFGSKYHGRLIGSVGDLVCFSFDSIKNITCGEGGAIVAWDAAVLHNVETMRMLGVEKSGVVSPDRSGPDRFQVRGQGYRYHMSDINAAIGIEQLAKAELFANRRREIFRFYNESLKDCRALKLPYMDLMQAVPHIYVVQVANGKRDMLRDHLADKGIETALHYYPNHRHAYYRNDSTQLPETDRLYTEILSLPLHCRLSDDEVAYISKAVRDYVDS